MKKIIYIILLISFNSVGFSIIDFQSHLIDKEDGLKLRANFGIKQLTGNTEIFAYNIDGSVKFISQDHLILAIGKYSYAEYTANNLTSSITNKYMFHLRYKYQIFNWLGFEVFGQEEFDEFRRIEDRAIVGGGPRITFYQSKAFEINFGTAYMFEYNKLIGNTASKTFSDADKKTTTHRLSSYFNIYVSLADNLKLFSTIYYQPAFEDFSNYRLLNENTLELSVNKTVSIQASYILAYDSIPPVDVEKKDITFIGSISIKLDLLKKPIKKNNNDSK